MSVQAQVNERLAALTAAGTAVWLDEIRRDLVEGGELQRLIDEDSLHGVTTNPAIFEKAILGSDEYDEELARYAKEGLSAEEIFDHIAVYDVQMGCDLLRPIWDSLDGHDGFVRSRWPRGWPMTPRAPSRPPSTTGRSSTAPTSW